MRATLSLLRLKQWVKNVFVFAALVFSRKAGDPASLEAAISMFLAFSFAASAMYAFNDVLDADADRRHPEKRNRPVASGAISPGAALAIALLALCGAAVACWSLPPLARLAVGAYVVMTAAYSLGLKRIVLLDIFIIAAGFMLRVMAGGYAIQVENSSWLVLCTLFLSLLLGAAKRRSELRRADGEAGAREVLAAYELDVIDQITTVCAAGAAIAYALYTVSERTIREFGSEKLIYTTIFVLYSIFRYLYLEKRSRIGESPTDVLFSDRPLMAAIALWLVSVTGIIYLRF